MHNLQKSRTKDEEIKGLKEKTHTLGYERFKGPFRTSCRWYRSMVVTLTHI